MGHGGAGPQPGPQPGQEESGDASDLVKQATDLIQQAISAETEPADAHLLAKVLTLLHQYIADEQKMHDDALGGSNMKLLRKAG